MATAPLALPALSAMSPAVSEWVASVRQLTQPERVHWCEGSDDEYRGLIAELEASGELQKLNEAHYPNCFLARSHPSDVARVEHLTFVCTTDREDAGPNNHWMAPADARISGAMMPAAPSMAHRPWMTSEYASHLGLTKPPAPSGSESPSGSNP